MKKLIAIFVVVAILASMSVSVSAATTTLTTTVPAATYTMNIPADQEIPFGATVADIGNITVTDSSGFAEGKDLQVTVTYDGAFKADDIITTIPYYICAYGTYHVSGTGGGADKDVPFTVKKTSGSSFIFKGQTSGVCSKYFSLDYSDKLAPDSSKKIQIKVTSEDWGKALAGVYSTTLTFTSEVIATVE